MSTELFLDYLGMRLNGSNAGDRTMTLVLALTDIGETWTLLVRNGALSHRATDTSDADVRVSIARSDLNEVILGTAPLADQIADGHAQLDGDEQILHEFVACSTTSSSGSTSSPRNARGLRNQQASKSDAERVTVSRIPDATGPRRHSHRAEPRPRLSRKAPPDGAPRFLSSGASVSTPVAANDHVQANCDSEGSRPPSFRSLDALPKSCLGLTARVALFLPVVVSERLAGLAQDACLRVTATPSPATGRLLSWTTRSSATRAL